MKRTDEHNRSKSIVESKEVKIDRMLVLVPTSALPVLYFPNKAMDRRVDRLKPTIIWLQFVSHFIRVFLYGNLIREPKIINLFYEKIQQLVVICKDSSRLTICAEQYMRKADNHCFLVTVCDSLPDLLIQV